MIHSIGTLYAIQDLFDHLGKASVAKEEFLEGFVKYGTSTAKDVYETATSLSWICTADSGQLVPTEIGKSAHRGDDRPTRLRFQLASIIEVMKPVWAGLLVKGRREAQAGMPDEIRQCFEEALLLDEANNEIIEWWDRLSCIMREFTQRKQILVGRQGERLSVAYEKKRTNKAPKWQSIESNYAGYDVLSIRAKGDERPIKIEVKASERTFKLAQIFVTEHEWITASQAKDSYQFHIWLLEPVPTLFIVPSVNVVAHIPQNQGKGTWRNACIPMNALTQPSQGLKHE
jgi:hypothetical protein